MKRATVQSAVPKGTKEGALRAVQVAGLQDVTGFLADATVGRSQKVRSDFRTALPAPNPGRIELRAVA